MLGLLEQGQGKRQGMERGGSPLSVFPGRQQGAAFRVEKLFAVGEADPGLRRQR